MELENHYTAKDYRQARQHRATVAETVRKIGRLMASIEANSLTPEQVARVIRTGYGAELKRGDYARSCEELEECVFHLDNSRRQGSHDAARALDRMAETMREKLKGCKGRRPKDWTAQAAYADALNLIEELGENLAEGGPVRMLPDLDAIRDHERQTARNRIRAIINANRASSNADE